MEVINFLTDFAKNNGALSLIVLVSTVIVTNIIKIPIKKHARKIAALATKSGFKIKESFVTSSIVYIPFGVSFVLLCAGQGIGVALGKPFDFIEIAASFPVIGAASIGLYSVVTNAVEKASQKDEYKEFAKSQIVENAVASEQQIISEVPVVATKTAQQTAMRENPEKEEECVAQEPTETENADCTETKIEQPSHDENSPQY